jgi:hypothetical protein
MVVLLATAAYAPKAAAVEIGRFPAPDGSFALAIETLGDHLAVNRMTSLIVRVVDAAPGARPPAPEHPVAPVAIAGEPPIMATASEAAAPEEPRAPVPSSSSAESPAPALSSLPLTAASEALPSPAKPLAVAREAPSVGIAYTDLTVAARMPAHNHGTFLTPRAVLIAPGVFRVDGVKFHMRGAWQMTLTLRMAQEPVTVVAPLTL